MSQTKHEIESLLAAAGAQPRHRFGQNFMIDRNLVRLVAEAGEIVAEDSLIEVGPGTGTLTEELLERAGSVVAVEIDRQLASLLRLRFAGRAGFTLMEGDALAGKHHLNAGLLEYIRRQTELGRRVKLVANLPYNIASPLVIELLIAGTNLLAFTVQKEVAQRLRAAANTDGYGPLSVVAQSLATVELMRTLPPQAFWPAPGVESALVRLRRRDTAVQDALRFGTFVHAVFSYRRKTLRKALAEAGYDSAALLLKTGFDGAWRPEQLAPTDFIELHRAARNDSPPEAASP